MKRKAFPPYYACTPVRAGRKLMLNDMIWQISMLYILSFTCNCHSIFLFISPQAQKFLVRILGKNRAWVH